MKQFSQVQFYFVFISLFLWNNKCTHTQVNTLCLQSSTVQVNRTHFEFKNRMSVRLRAEEVISRRDLKIIWVCVYPRHYVRNTQVSVGMER